MKIFNFALLSSFLIFSSIYASSNYVMFRLKNAPSIFDDTFLTYLRM